MTEIIERNKLIELVIEKHKKLLDTYNSEFSDVDTRLASLKQQSDLLKKEIETTKSRIEILNEKYHLLFYQAKKQREEIFQAAIEKLRAGKAANLQDIMRSGSRIQDNEKKLQDSRHIDDEEKILTEIKKDLFELESAAGKTGMILTFKGVFEKLDEANRSHKELISLETRPEKHTDQGKDYGRQVNEIEGRHNWLRHRIESHHHALDYWVKQKGDLYAA